MVLIYITGISGSGKSTVWQELLRRGYRALGGSEDNLAAFYNNVSGKRVERIVPASERTAEWLSKHTWRIPKESIESLRASAQGELIFVCSDTLNDEAGLWGVFDKIIALTIDEGTLRSRLVTRTNSDWGRSPSELAFILNQQKSREKDYKKFSAIMIDSTRPVEKVVDEILERIRDL